MHRHSIMRNGKKNTDKHPQTFLESRPVTVMGEVATVHLMEGFPEGEFRVNGSRASVRRWEVYDRTTGRKHPGLFWCYEKEAGNVVLQDAIPGHTYTVGFFAYCMRGRAGDVRYPPTQGEKGRGGDGRGGMRYEAGMVCGEEWQAH